MREARILNLSPMVVRSLGSFFGGEAGPWRGKTLLGPIAV